MMRVLLFTMLLIALTSMAAAEKVTYSYDDAGRLVRVDYGNGKSIAYTYDQAGNLLSRAISGPAAAGAASEKKRVTPPKAPIPRRAPARKTPRN